MVFLTRYRPQTRKRCVACLRNSLRSRPACFSMSSSMSRSVAETCPRARFIRASTKLRPKFPKSDICNSFLRLLLSLLPRKEIRSYTRPNKRVYLTSTLHDLHGLLKKKSTYSDIETCFNPSTKRTGTAMRRAGSGMSEACGTIGEDCYRQLL